MQQPDINERRRLNLLSLCRERFDNNRAEMARISGINPNQVGLALTDNEDNRRPIGEHLARRIEKGLSLEEGYLDRIPGATDSIQIPAPCVIPEVQAVLATSTWVSALAVTRTWIAKNYVEAPERLLIAEVTSDGAAPDIQPGEQVVLEWLGDDHGKPSKAEKAFTRDGVYVIDTKVGVLLRRIKRRVDATYQIGPDSEGTTTTLKGINFFARVVTPLRFG